MAAAAAAETATTQNNILEWVKKDNRRLLHVVYRVADLEKTIKYACSQHMLGMLKKKFRPNIADYIVG
jgi:lactoylglutathione lyase